MTDQTFTATRFTSIDELLSEVDRSISEIDAGTSLDTPQLDGVRSLRLRKPRASIPGWWLVEAGTRTPIHDVTAVIGACVASDHGRTSPIAAIDPKTRRVETLSGSVYQLGMPESVFAAKARHTLRRLGF